MCSPKTGTNLDNRVSARYINHSLRLPLGAVLVATKLAMAGVTFGKPTFQAGLVYSGQRTSAAAGRDEVFAIPALVADSAEYRSIPTMSIIVQ